MHLIGIRTILLSSTNWRAFKVLLKSEKEIACSGILTSISRLIIWLRRTALTLKRTEICRHIPKLKNAQFIKSRPPTNDQQSIEQYPSVTNDELPGRVNIQLFIRLPHVKTHYLYTLSIRIQTFLNLYRERERERERDTICACVCTYSSMIELYWISA